MVESLQKENQNLKHSVSWYVHILPILISIILLYTCYTAFAGSFTSNERQMTFSIKKGHKKVARHFKDLFQKAFLNLPGSIPDHLKKDVWSSFLKLFEVCHQQAMYMS